MKKNIVKCQYRLSKDGELILVYINNRGTKRFYEIYSIIDCCHCEIEKETIVNAYKPQNSEKYKSVTKILRNNNIIDSNWVIVDRLPRL